MFTESDNKKEKIVKKKKDFFHTIEWTRLLDKIPLGLTVLYL